MVIVTVILALAGCTYMDQEIYYVVPVPSDSADIAVTTNLDTSEQVVITDSMMFRYRSEIEGGELYFAEATIGKLILYQLATNYDPDTVTGPYILTDSFWIRSDIAPATNIYSMQFSLYYSSNTNSLADFVGIEADMLNLEFDLLLEGGGK